MTQTLRNDQYVPLVQIEPPNAVDNQEWRRIHKEHPTLSSFGEDKTVRFRGWAFKRGEKKGMVGGFPWAKRFWILTEKFAIYFKNDSAGEKAAGCIYIKSCGFTVLGEMEGHPNALKVMPCVPRRPGDSLVGDAPHFVISIPENPQYEQWLEFIQSKSKAYQTKLQLAMGDGVTDT